MLAILCRYPHPCKCTYDKGKEFISEMFQELLDSYKIKPNLIIIKNLQANGVIE